MPSQSDVDTAAEKHRFSFTDSGTEQITSSDTMSGVEQATSDVTSKTLHEQRDRNSEGAKDTVKDSNDSPSSNDRGSCRDEKTAEDGEPSDDSSSGDEVDEYAEIRGNRELRWMSLEEKWKSMKSRVKVAPSRIKQQRQYLTLLEDRVALMEALIDDMLQDDSRFQDTTKDEPSLPLSECPAITFKANIAPISPEYFKNAIETAPKAKVAHAVIDVVLQQTMPNMTSKMQSTWTRMGLEQPLRSAQSQDELSKELEATKGVRLPDRIRVKSALLIAIIAKIIDPNGDRLRSRKSIVFHAPYKPLIYYADELRELSRSMKTAAEASNLSRNSAKDVAATKHSEHVTKVAEEVAKSKKDSLKTRATSRKVLTSSEATTNINSSSDNDTLDPGSNAPRDKPKRTLLEELYRDLECFSELLVTCPSCVFGAIDHLDILVGFIDAWLLPVTTKLRVRAVKKVRFTDLWHLYSPGDVVVEKHLHEAAADYFSPALAMRVLRRTGGTLRNEMAIAAKPNSKADENGTKFHDDLNVFVVHTYHIDYDGFKFVPVTKRYQILPFQGERMLDDLDLFPISSAKDIKFSLHVFGERGSLFAQHVVKPKYMHCRGRDLATKEEIDGPVMVDVAQYFRTPKEDDGPAAPPPTFNKPSKVYVPGISDGPCYCGQDGCPYLRSLRLPDRRIETDGYIDNALDDITMDDYIKSLSLFGIQRSSDQVDVLERDDLSICHYRTYAYVLRQRKWVEIHVKTLRDSENSLDSRAFDKLVLPPAHRRMIKSQVELHFRHRSHLKPYTDNDADFVRGKGRGLIILLHGAPGVGKTSTAECIADSVNKPLLPITCGDLGTNAGEVETQLQKHFKLAGHWGCVMLLDEADIFLTRRNREDYMRNAIVSVFLRMLEYYTGLLFLTTNRVGTFDEAFKSRIHISLNYKEFNRKATIKVWERFIDHTEEQMVGREDIKLKIKRDEILRFAEEHFDEDKNGRWNGRQIRNAFQTALAMAEYEARHPENPPSKVDKTATKEGPVKVRLSAKQFVVIASTILSFDKYIQDTIGMTYERQAFVDSLRQDVDRLKQNFGQHDKGTKKQSKDAKLKAVLQAMMDEEPGNEDTDASDTEPDQRVKFKTSKGMKSKASNIERSSQSKDKASKSSKPPVPAVDDENEASVKKQDELDGSDSDAGGQQAKTASWNTRRKSVIFNRGDTDTDSD